MMTAVIFTSGALLLLAVFHAVITVLFVAQFFRKPRQVGDAQHLPRAAILLPLRGADPDLGENLRRLFHQQYPDHLIQIVVDCQEDPAWGVVQQIVAEEGGGRVRVSTLRSRRNTCSLHCSALSQAVEDLDESVEVVAIIDGDVVAHPTWLRELVAPLSEPGVGITHGNRWFVPREAGWGCLVRSLWNAAAVVPMHFFTIPWGGSLAIRKSVLKESGLLAVWSRSLVPDAPAKSLLSRMGLRIRFVPSLMMVNREYCDLAFSRDFLMRQMTWTRTYHPNWTPVVLHAVVTTGLLLLAPLLVVAGLANNRPEAAGWAAAGFFGYWATMLGLQALLEYSVRRVVRVRGEPTGRISLGTVVKLPLAMLLTQATYFVTVLEAVFRRRVTWRGVTYEIRGPLDVSILADRPVAEPLGPMGSRASL